MSTGKILYISDLDGTLLNNSAELSDYTKNALNEMIANGLIFSVATARTAASAFKILDGVQWNIPLVLMNGVLIYDSAQQRYVQILPLAAETAAAVIAAFKDLGVTGLMYQLKDSEQQTYYESLDRKPLRDFVNERIIRYKKKFHQTDSLADVPLDQIIYFTLLDTYDRIRPVYDNIVKLSDISLAMYKDNYSEDLWYLEIFNAKASKQTGVQFLRDMYGFERIVGFGDNLNDLPMFDACDVRVAVENAKDDVKAVADFICGPNNNDGVAKWIEKHVL